MQHERTTLGPRRHQTLSESLEQLERTDPAVAKAAAELDRVKTEILAGGSYRQRARRAIKERKNS